MHKLLLTVIFAGFIAVYSFANEPLPDIWGYDIDDIVNIKEDSFISMSGCKTKNGDFIIALSHSKVRNIKDELKPIKFTEKYLINFFKNEIIKMPNDFYYYNYFQKECAVESSSSKPITFSDGSILHVNTRGGGSLCHHNWAFESFLKYNDKEISILMPTKFPIREYDDSGNVCSNTGPLSYYQLVEANNLLMLPDDTFLVINEVAGYIIRFTQDFRSRFVAKPRIYTERIGWLKGAFFVLHKDFVDDSHTGAFVNHPDNIITSAMDLISLKLYAIQGKIPAIDYSQPDRCPMYHSSQAD